MVSYVFPRTEDVQKQATATTSINVPAQTSTPTRAPTMMRAVYEVGSVSVGTIGSVEGLTTSVDREAVEVGCGNDDSKDCDSDGDGDRFSSQLLKDHKGPRGVQVHPGSIVQLLEQPSPSILLLSSHSSSPVLSPFPHLLTLQDDSARGSL